MDNHHPKVDVFVERAENWKEEMIQLRSILLDSQLTEVLKWGAPCYSYQNKNVAIIGAFKHYCALSFFKGALLKDAQKILVKPGENSQASRLIKFTSDKAIVEMESIIKAYILEAIELEKSGLKIDFKAKEELQILEELQLKLDEDPALKTAFEALTPGRQRGYQLYFSAPKQSKTRINRIEKYIPKILSGKGFHDCTCGLSKRLPTCDGSHKSIQ